MATTLEIATKIRNDATKIVEILSTDDGVPLLQSDWLSDAEQLVWDELLQIRKFAGRSDRTNNIKLEQRLETGGDIFSCQVGDKTHKILISWKENCRPTTPVNYPTHQIKVTDH